PALVLVKRRRLSWHRRGVVLGLEEPPSDRAVVGPARRRRPDSTHVRRESNLVARGESPGVAPRPARRPDGKARRLRISGIFEGGATQPAGMHRRPNAAGLSPRAVRAHLGSTANSRTLGAKELIMDGVRMRPSKRTNVRRVGGADRSFRRVLIVDQTFGTCVLRA